MIRNWTIGLALGAAVLVALVTAVAQTRVVRETRVDTPAGSAQLAATKESNLSGAWRLDASRSTLRGRFGDRSGRGGRKGDGEGRGAWTGRGEGKQRDGAHRGEPRGDRDGRGFGNRGRRLPAFLTIHQSSGRIELADSTGAAVQEILIGSKVRMPDRKDGGSEDDARVRSASGVWRDGALEVQRTTPRGVMIQTFSLEDGGRTLVVRTTRRDGESSGEAREGRGPRGGMTLVYRKVAS